jgi:hypothetical protein
MIDELTDERDIYVGVEQWNGNAFGIITDHTEVYGLGNLQTMVVVGGCVTPDGGCI